MACLLIPIAFMVWMLAVFAVAFLPLRLPVGICRRCGYSLVGLRESGRCPECGTGFNQLRVQRLVRPWGSTGESLALFGILAVAGGGAMVLCVACGGPSVLVLAMGMGVGPIAPPAVLIGLGLGRLPRGVVWGICLAGGLSGLLVGTAGFVAAATSGDGQAAIAMMVVPIFGSAISALISGLIAGIAAMMLHSRMARLKRGGERRGREGSHG